MEIRQVQRILNSNYAKIDQMLLVKSVWNYHMLSDEDEVSVAVQLSKLIKDTSPFIRSNE